MHSNDILMICSLRALLKDPGTSFKEVPLMHVCMPHLSAVLERFYIFAYIKLHLFIHSGIAGGQYFVDICF